MPLRCLVFSSNEEMLHPIWQVLADLGIEGEYCKSAVDAVERVTTQQFQIVITDWDDQPEAAFLLKTARDLKAAQRPLTLAIVGDDARLPEALKAGANSVLVKPIRADQVRDTMSTACELLRAKQQPAVQQPVAPVASVEIQESATMSATASAGAVSAPWSVPSSVPPSVTQAPEKTIRAGEFLQSARSAPGAQFDTEDAKSEVDTSMEHAAAEDVDVLTELEPMAAAVEDTPAEPPAPPEPLTGWAALQSRLTRSAPPPAEDAPAKSGLLSYGETPSYGTKAESPAETGKESPKKQSQPESGSEAALFAYIPGEPAHSSELAAGPHAKRGRIFLAGILAACMALMAVPRARQGVRTAFRSAVRAGGSWLNPPPAPVPQAVPQHDSFGQSGDEYKLPTVANIPDATTDPSQIQVLPVLDPTAKPQKGSEANGGQATPGENNPNAAQNQTGVSRVEQNQTGPSPNGQEQLGGSAVNDPAAASVADVPGDAAGAVPGAVPSARPPQPNAPEAKIVSPPQPRPTHPPGPSPAPVRATPAVSGAGIPSSLRSKMASMTPEAGGNKPVEAAMSSIEPVTLTESAVRDLLSQPVDAEYPAGAKASGQRGSVVLQVLIGRDGAVQDAKFLQGSLVFARAAIDAVKQWRFKPYSMNGRPVSVQSVITLKFQPPS
ncbi:MAG TPA: TonB family protein [Candidatus Acidoferrum sp.]|nr:TonB family protein [Candidatus Acidoferrum sp.]